MQQIYTFSDNDGALIQKVIAALEQHPELLSTAKRFREQLKEEESGLPQQYREAAFEHQRDGEIEVDEGAVVSLGADDGAYVQAWLWVSNREAGVENDEDDDDGVRDEEIKEILEKD